MQNSIILNYIFNKFVFVSQTFCHSGLKNILWSRLNYYNN